MCFLYPDFDNDYNTSDDECDDLPDEFEKNEILRNNIINWTLKYNINHLVLKGIVEIINERFDKEILPKDPRTLLKTPRMVTIVPIADEQYYWHNGIRFCLENLFSDLSNSITISLNINMDGLPIYKSSREEFWPILFNIFEMPNVAPMVAGIYSGKSKPSNVAGFLMPMVNELKSILQEGIIINDNKITVKIRCFIADSPARAFIKGIVYIYICRFYSKFVHYFTLLLSSLGVANYNGQHGCLKCTTIGEYNDVSHERIARNELTPNFVRKPTVVTTNMIHLYCSSIST